MNGLLQHWLLSLSMLRPSFLLKFIVSALKKLLTSLTVVVLHFPWIFGIDLFVIVIFGGKIMSFMLSAALKNPMARHPVLGIATLVIGVMTFLMKVFFELFLRRDHFLLNPRTYLQAYVFKYVQFEFFVVFVLTFMRLLLLGFGVVQIPHIPELLLFLFLTFKTFAMFFWLDSAHTLRSLIRSCERAANLVIYTLPLVLFIAAISFGALGLLYGVVLGWDKVLSTPYMMTSFVDIFTSVGTQPALWRILVVKYAHFIIDCLVAALLYTWYRRKRGVTYAAPLFEESEIS